MSSLQDNQCLLRHIEVKRVQSCIFDPKQTLKEQLPLQEREFQNRIMEIKKENQKLIVIQQ